LFFPKIDDGEGELLQRIRAVAPICPIGVCLDLHGNTTKLMLDNSSFMASYQTYPHIDMRETGCRVARVVLDRLLAESVSLSKVLIQIPVLASTLCSRTDVDGPMLRAVNAAKHLEDRGLVVSASILAGFPLSDVEFAGISIVGYSTSEDSLQVVMKDLAQQIESERELFVFRPEPAQISVDHLINAVSLPNRQSYVALLDHADNVMSGGSASSAEVLRLLLERGRAAAPFLVGPIFDAKFVESLPADAKHVHWRPTQVTKELVVQGTIQAVSDGTFVVTG
jgi:microcystin degradation protein MlrC